MQIDTLSNARCVCLSFLRSGFAVNVRTLDNSWIHSWRQWQADSQRNALSRDSAPRLFSLSSDWLNVIVFLSFFIGKWRMLRPNVSRVTSVLARVSVVTSLLPRGRKTIACTPKTQLASLFCKLIFLCNNLVVCMHTRWTEKHADKTTILLLGGRPMQYSWWQGVVFMMKRCKSHISAINRYWWLQNHVLLLIAKESA